MIEIAVSEVLTKGQRKVLNVPFDPRSHSSASLGAPNAHPVTRLFLVSLRRLFWSAPARRVIVMAVAVAAASVAGALSAAPQTAKGGRDAVAFSRPAIAAVPSWSASWTRSAAAIENAAMEALLAPLQTARAEETLRVRRGETLERLLTRAGVDDSRTRYDIIRALESVFDARSLRAGQDVNVFLEDAGRTRRLAGLAFEPDDIRTIHLSADAQGQYHAREFVTPLTRRTVSARGVIENSLYVDAIASGAHHATIVDIANLLGFSVDFQREIHPGDPFEILFEEWVAPDGRAVRAGDLLYVGFAPKGRPLAYWRYENGDGDVDFYDADGESARRALMKTPINGARLSSHFGKRRHPILGYTRLHKGTDFAAPRGTPVFAAGDGVVERASRYGGYGHYIRLRHANGYKTAYAHLRGYARGVRSGVRVRQGEVIGYVGSTGRSTGPHLHYEVMKNGRHVNPMKLSAPTGRTLTAAEKQAFAAVRSRLDALRALHAGDEDHGATSLIAAADTANRTP